jgi:hypothetical protein
VALKVLPEAFARDARRRKGANRPRQVKSQRASALRFGDPKVQALWSALLVFPGLPTGFSDRNLREPFASLLGRTVHGLTRGQRPTSSGGFACTRSSSVSPNLTATASRTSVIARLCFACEAALASCAPVSPKHYPKYPARTTSYAAAFNKLQEEIHSCVDAARLTA